MCVSMCQCVDPTGPVEQLNMIIYCVFVCVDVSMCRPHWSSGTIKYDNLLSVCVCRCVDPTGPVEQ